MTSSTVRCPACEEKLPLTPSGNPLEIPEAAALIEHARTSACGAVPAEDKTMVDAFTAALMNGGPDGSTPIVLRRPRQDQ